MAKITEQEYETAVIVIKKYREQCIEELQYVEDQNRNLLKGIPSMKIIYTPSTTLNHVIMSTGLVNSIKAVFNKRANEIQMRDLSEFTEQEVFSWRNTGVSKLEELKKVLAQSGLTLFKKK